MSEQFSLIHHFLEKSANCFPEKIAIIHENIRKTYGELNTMANKLANRLEAQGVVKGDRVVLLMENCSEYVISYYGALKIGAIVVPLNTELKPDSLKPLLEELEPKTLIASTRFERLLKASELENYHIERLILNNPKLNWNSDNCSTTSWDSIMKEGVSENPEMAINPGDVACIIYTSGSTGTPKGVMLSHNNIVVNTRSIRKSLDLTENDIQMVVLPFFYVMGKSLLNTHFSVGGTVVINNKFAYPATVIKQMIEEKVTGFSGVPSTYAYLLHRSPLKNHRDQLVSLRYCSQAGGHMSRHIKEKLKESLPENTKIFIMYGATEASARLTCLPSELFSQKTTSIGAPIDGVTLKIVDYEGRELQSGEKGELVASGDNIMLGYWKDRESTASVLRDGAYHTGDLGYMDSDGLFYVEGRKDGLLKVGGHRINPLEVEDAMIESDLIIEAAVLGIPDEMLGNKLVALVVGKGDEIDKNLILGKMAEKLQRYKMPSDIIMVKGLPKHSSGKTDKTKCLELVTKSG